MIINHHEDIIKHVVGLLLMFLFINVVRCSYILVSFRPFIDLKYRHTTHIHVPVHIFPFISKIKQKKQKQKNVFAKNNTKLDRQPLS